MPIHTTNVKYDRIIPDAASVSQSLRAFGYSLETALADIIDNSITAKANQIDITFELTEFDSFIRIEDNGTGMSHDELVKAMTIGSSNPIEAREHSDLGRFGMGLKSASFSQCTRLSVRTRKQNSQLSATRVWDLDMIQKYQDWALLTESIDSESEQNLGNLKNQSGTIVLWEKLDRLIEKHANFDKIKRNFYNKIGDVGVHLGIVFHRFIEEDKIIITMNGEKIRSVNPFYFSDPYLTKELSAEDLKINNQNLSVKSYILPHESKLTAQDLADAELIKGWSDHQGIYLYRNKRLIIGGGWLNLPFKRKESQRLARILIDIPNTLDKEWQIDIKKASAKVPDSIREHVIRIIRYTLPKAIQIYAHRATGTRQVSGKGNKEIIHIWGFAKNNDGTKTYNINKNNILYQLLESNLSIEDKKVLDDFLKIIETTLPTHEIINDFMDKTSLVQNPQSISSNSDNAYQNILDDLINMGMSEADAKRELNKLAIFQ